MTAGTSSTRSSGRGSDAWPGRLRYTLLMRSIPASLTATVAQLEKGLQALYGTRFRGLLLYGSYARGEETEGSDVDLLLLLDGPVNAGREIWRMGAVLGPLSLASGLVLSVLPLSVEDYQEKDSGYLRKVRKEAIDAA